MQILTLIRTARVFATTIPGAMSALVRANEQQQAEIERLRALLAKHDQRPALTDREDRARSFVALNPGAPVREIARAMVRDSTQWTRTRDEEPSSYEVDGETKFIYSAFKKGHLRREQEGTSFRYWPIN